MNYKQNVLILTLSFLVTSLFAQDMKYANKLIKELSSESYYGRGYINKGDSIAAVYLSKEMKQLKLDGFESNYYQSYTTPMNTYPEDPVLILGDNKLESAQDFIVYPDSPSCEGTFDLLWLNAEMLTQRKARRDFLKKDLSNTFLALDSAGLNNKKLYEFAYDLVNYNVFGAKGIVVKQNKLKFSARTKLNDFPSLLVKSPKLDATVSKITVKIKNKFIESYQTQNLLGYIQGKSDTCIVYCAHYDHLGMLGSKVYPGANDNATGVAMVLNLAKHYKKQRRKPQYTQVFILFSGEEAGMLGSKYYVEKPLFPLEKTKMVLNFDMIGTGSKGIVVYNGVEFPEEMALFKKINNKERHVNKLLEARVVPFSDHASFYNKGVKAVFFYADGKNDVYHETTDILENMTFYQYGGIFKLVRDFSDQLHQ